GGEAAGLARLAARANRGGIVGCNIGANKLTEDRGADYVRLIEAFAPVVSYFTVNISSPNTPGLRDLQQAAAPAHLTTAPRAAASLGALPRRARPRLAARGRHAGAGQDRARSHPPRARR